MAIPPYASWMLEQEARALLTRLARVKPFALQETMLPAAGLLPTSQIAIESFLTHGRRKLQRLIRSFLRFLKTAPPWMDAAGAQRRFSILRLRFVGVLTHFDLFNDVITQRSENEIGVWLSGLDVVSADALKLRQPVFDPPPVICYLDRGVGAAIRNKKDSQPDRTNEVPRDVTTYAAPQTTADISEPVETYTVDPQGTDSYPADADARSGRR